MEETYLEANRKALNEKVVNAQSDPLHVRRVQTSPVLKKTNVDVTQPLTARTGNPHVRDIDPQNLDFATTLSVGSSSGFHLKMWSTIRKTFERSRKQLASKLNLWRTNIKTKMD